MRVATFEGAITFGICNQNQNEVLILLLYTVQGQIIFIDCFFVHITYRAEYKFNSNSLNVLPGH